MGQKDDGDNTTRLVVQYDDHPKYMSTVLCSLMEHQSLVDIAIRCGNQTLHAHKVILASNSPYLREQLENNPETEQIIVNGMDFITLKCIIEFIYCGETNILEANLKYVVAAAKLFQIRGIQAIGSEAPDGDEIIYYPPPIFMNQKPKYSSAYMPYSQISGSVKPKLNPDEPDYQVNDSNDYVHAINYGDHMENPNVHRMDVIDMRNMRYQDGEPLDILYQNPDGQYMQVSKDFFRNMTENSMQYQVINANMPGHEPVNHMPSASTENLGALDGGKYNHNEDDDEEIGQIAKTEPESDYNDDAYYSGGGGGGESYPEVGAVGTAVRGGLNMLLNFQQHAGPETMPPAVVDLARAGDGGGVAHAADTVALSECAPEALIIDQDTPFMDAAEASQLQNAYAQDMPKIEAMPYYDDAATIYSKPMKIEDEYSQHADSEAIQENEILMQTHYNKENVDISVIGVEPLAGVGQTDDGVGYPSDGEIINYIKQQKRFNSIYQSRNLGNIF